MPKSLRTFLEDMHREVPEEIVHISKVVNPANYDVTAIIKHLGALKKFPIVIFDRPLNLHGRVSEIKLVMNCEISQRKVQIALGVPRETDRAELARECLRREAHRLTPVVVPKGEAPVKEVIHKGSEVDLFELPIMRHHEMDGGPYIDMSSVGRDRETGVYNVSYHRMEVKDRNHTAFVLTLQHMWRIFRGYESHGEECPVATVIGHHPAYQMGACYGGPFEVDEYEDIDVYNPTEILWALATRVQPHRQVSIIEEIMRASLVDPSIMTPRKTSAMIIDTTRPLDRPFSPVSKCPDEALAKIRLEDYIPGEILQHIPIDRTTYWC